MITAYRSLPLCPIAHPFPSPICSLIKMGAGTIFTCLGGKRGRELKQMQRIRESVIEEIFRQLKYAGKYALPGYSAFMTSTRNNFRYEKNLFLAEGC